MNQTLRIMTYNVHSCVGTDRRLDPSRIAEVIAFYEPDIVALQELDALRIRSGRNHQTKLIAEQLKMHFHFHAAMLIQEEEYGDAILSKWPIQLRHAGILPTAKSRLAFEPRGALWVTIHKNGQEVQLINTHLGLSSKERLAQIEALISPHWLNHPDCKTPRILCGDFNALPDSAVHRKALQHLNDSQRALKGHRPKATFPSRYPLIRLDYVFTSQDLEVLEILVPKTQLTKVASDHLPLIVDVQLPTFVTPQT